jgi:hypothetical protein
MCLRICRGFKSEKKLDPQIGNLQIAKNYGPQIRKLPHLRKVSKSKKIFVRNIADLRFAELTCGPPTFGTKARGKVAYMHVSASLSRAPSKPTPPLFCCTLPDPLIITLSVFLFSTWDYEARSRRLYKSVKKPAVERGGGGAETHTKRQATQRAACPACWVKGLKELK